MAASTSFSASSHPLLYQLSRLLLARRRLRSSRKTQLGSAIKINAAHSTTTKLVVSDQDCVGSCFKELQSLFHERLVVLEDASMPGILIEDQLGIRKAPRQVDRVAAGHHLVALTIRHQNRVMNARQLVGTLAPPGVYGLQLGDERRDRKRGRRRSANFGDCL